MENGENTCHYFIYGIIKADSPQQFGDVGIGNTASNVHTLGFRDIAAVVSRSPFVLYDSLAKEKTVKDLITHQLVIEKVMQSFTVVPVKFGTTVQTVDEVIAFLQKSYPLLCNELAKMEEKIELDIVASWDLPKILARLRAHDGLIQEKQAEIARKGDKVSLEDKVALGRLIEQTLKAEKARYNQLITQTLENEAIAVCPHELVGDEMIFNSAFLLEKQKEQDFNEFITTLDQVLENAVIFRVVGPLPVYSFSTILLERIDPVKLAEAKKLFALDGELTEKTVHDAYRRLAQKNHPDTSNDKDTSTFPAIHAAYKILRNFVKCGLMHVEVYRWEKDLK